MQSNKASKKTRKDVSEPVAANSMDVSGIAEKAAQPRSSKSSLSKSETVERASAKKHRKAATVNVPGATMQEAMVQEAMVQEPVSAPKAMAAAAGSMTTASVLANAVSLDAAPVAKSEPEVSRERIQELAYRFWMEDGRPNGNHFEHWLRAERELGIRK